MLFFFYQRLKKIKRLISHEKSKGQASGGDNLMTETGYLVPKSGFHMTHPPLKKKKKEFFLKTQKIELSGGRS